MDTHTGMLPASAVPASASPASAAPAWWLAALLGGGIALLAWRRGSLQPRAALLAAGMGTVTLRTGWNWGLYLVAWFLLASLVSRLGRQTKARRTDAVVAKGSERDLRQVLANGGLYLGCAGALWWPTIMGADGSSVLWAVAGAAALAATGADTWSTEIGTWRGGTPWSFRTGGRVAAGSSGAVTLAGSLGGVAGALVLAGVAVAVGLVPRAAAVPVAVAGITGALADTLIGAWWQVDRWCPACESATERPVHHCGASTTPARGLHWLENDGVNLLCSVVGALTGVALWRLG